jgi:hypothetical protein
LGAPAGGRSPLRLLSVQGFEFRSNVVEQNAGEQDKDF